MLKCFIILEEEEMQLSDGKWRVVEGLPKEEELNLDFSGILKENQSGIISFSAFPLNKTRVFSGLPQA